MKLISDDYLDVNMVLHADKSLTHTFWRKGDPESKMRVGSYGSGGLRWAEEMPELARRFECKNLLDYGCGKGTLSMAFEKGVVQNYDPAVEEFSEVPTEKRDLVVCTDVLEHVEPEYLDNVLKHIASLTGNVAFFIIATRKANRTLFDGRNAHLIIEDEKWWKAKLKEHFRVASYRVENLIPGEMCLIGIPK